MRSSHERHLGPIQDCKAVTMVRPGAEAVSKQAAADNSEVEADDDRVQVQLLLAVAAAVAGMVA